MEILSGIENNNPMKVTYSSLSSDIDQMKDELSAHKAEVEKEVNSHFQKCFSYLESVKAAFFVENTKYYENQLRKLEKIRDQMLEIDRATIKVDLFKPFDEESPVKFFTTPEKQKEIEQIPENKPAAQRKITPIEKPQPDQEPRRASIFDKVWENKPVDKQPPMANIFGNYQVKLPNPSLPRPVIPSQFVPAQLVRFPISQPFVAPCMKPSIIQTTPVSLISQPSELVSKNSDQNSRGYVNWILAILSIVTDKFPSNCKEFNLLQKNFNSWIKFIDRSSHSHVEILKIDSENYIVNFCTQSDNNKFVSHKIGTTKLWLKKSLKKIEPITVRSYVEGFAEHFGFDLCTLDLQAKQYFFNKFNHIFQCAVKYHRTNSKGGKKTATLQNAVPFLIEEICQVLNCQSFTNNLMDISNIDSSTVPKRFHVKHVDKIVANNLTDRRNKLIAYFNKFGSVKDMYLNEKFNAGLQQNLPLDYVFLEFEDYNSSARFWVTKRHYVDGIKLAVKAAHERSTDKAYWTKEELSETRKSESSQKITPEPSSVSFGPNSHFNWLIGIFYLFSDRDSKIKETCSFVDNVFDRKIIKDVSSENLLFQLRAGKTKNEIAVSFMLRGKFNIFGVANAWADEPFDVNELSSSQNAYLDKMFSSNVLSKKTKAKMMRVLFACLGKLNKITAVDDTVPMVTSIANKIIDASQVYRDKIHNKISNEQETDTEIEQQVSSLNSSYVGVPENHELIDSTSSKISPIKISTNPFSFLFEKTTDETDIENEN